MSQAKANLLENQLRHKVIQFENSLAIIADTRKHLKDNIDLVKNEIRAAFGTQLAQMRRREQQLLETLDTIASVKDGILSEQQDQLHQGLGACVQGLEWYQTAVEDMNESRLCSIDKVEHHITDVLKKMSIIDMKPRESAALSFEADSLALRKAISSFGHVRNGKSAAKSFESLPAQLEDYEDEDVVHSLLHKAVNRGGKSQNTIIIGRPQLSNDPKDWLLREALTGHHRFSEPPTPEHDHPTLRHCSTATVLTSGEVTMDGHRGGQGQVHSWLHQIKNQVETEPNVFEDFEIVKDGEVKNSMADAIKAELTQNVAALFWPYFEAILRSPGNQWLLKSMEKLDFSNMITDDDEKLDHLGKDYIFEGDTEDMDSCPSMVTYESSNAGDFHHVEKTLLQDETYSKLWKRFVDNLWNSTDSLWILPCSSTDQTPSQLTAARSVTIPVPNSDKASGNAEKSVASDAVENLIANWIEAMQLQKSSVPPAHHQEQCDYDRWLLKSNNRPSDDHLSTEKIRETYEDWLGWKKFLQHQHQIGMEGGWLFKEKQNPNSNQNQNQMDIA